ncbi:hypothetical protein [Nocardia aurantiaca]|uniref:Uncharacterized protein n=1 Tax=Nocardia aurantiaca TaxID=2675850 RepID=A0A6I3L1H5_9NOCA|nr:hypothetical protein [Nocardia aurantiaca]MTE14434.1 hypothetical protein [Nocardia aurantiaca]
MYIGDSNRRSSIIDATAPGACVQDNLFLAAGAPVTAKGGAPIADIGVARALSNSASPRPAMDAPMAMSAPSGKFAQAGVAALGS